MTGQTTSTVHVSYLVALRAEDGHGCEFSIKLTCICIAFYGWLPRRFNLATLQLLPLNDAKEVVGLDLLCICRATAQSFVRIPLEKSAENSL